MDGYDQVAEIGKALGHPVRLQILQVLREEEACVCHLEAILGQRQAYISQHLMRLREAGLVVDRREGMNVFYSLANEAIGSLLGAKCCLLRPSSTTSWTYAPARHAGHSGMASSPYLM